MKGKKRIKLSDLKVESFVTSEAKSIWGCGSNGGGQCGGNSPPLNCNGTGGG